MISNRKKHRSRIYRIWQAMKNRCYNQNSLRFMDYGGRGIEVCDEWKSDFHAFNNWAIANGYNDQLSIDRIDNDGNYEPSNCRWATHYQQVNNSRHNHLIEYQGQVHSLSEWARIVGLPRYLISNRLLNYGWTVERALSTPTFVKGDLQIRMNESQFKVIVQKFLTDIGAWHVKYMGTRYTKSGIPDILACIQGKFYGIELKTNYGIASPMQLRHLEKIEKAGGRGILLRPKEFDSFRKEVLAWIHSATAESNNGTNADSAGT